MDKPVAEIRDRLQQALKIRNKTAQDVSNRTNIPKSSISQYLSGYAKPKQDRLVLISEALNINPAWLLGYDVPIETVESKFEKIKNIINNFNEDDTEMIIEYSQLNDNSKDFVKSIVKREYQQNKK